MAELCKVACRMSIRICLQSLRIKCLTRSCKSFMASHYLEIYSDGCSSLPSQSPRPGEPSNTFYSEMISAVPRVVFIQFPRHSLSKNLQKQRQASIFGKIKIANLLITVYPSLQCESLCLKEKNEKQLLVNLPPVRRCLYSDEGADSLIYIFTAAVMP